MMVRTALLLDDFLKRHRTAEGHPECPERLDAIGSSLARLQNVVVLSSRRAGLDEIGLCHDPRYVEEVLDLIASGGADLSGGDVSVCDESGEVALHAAGGVLEAVDAVLIGHVENAFCAVRPPGHHARPAAAMGFCIFNNVAIAARHAQKKHGVERVAIVDWDVHHGNGTEGDFLFRRLGPLLFHAPVAVVSGNRPRFRDRGGQGCRAHDQLPAPCRVRAQEIFGAFRDRLLPALESYRPELLLISAGFDSRDGDPLGQFRLHDQDFADLTRMLMDFAAGPCAGRVVSVLEGGYNLSGLGTAVKSHVSQLIG